MRIQTKIILIVLGVLLVTGAFGGGLLIYLQRQAWESYLEGQASVLARTILVSLERHMMTGETSRAQEAVALLGQASTVTELRILDRQGRIAASARKTEVGAVSDDTRIGEALARGKATTWEEVAYGRSQMSMVLPIANKPACQGCHQPGQEFLGAIKVGIDASPMAAQVGQQVTLLSSFILIGIVSITGLLTLIFQRTIVRRLVRLKKAMAAVSQRDFSVRAEEEGKDELSELARMFNRMATQIAQAYEELSTSESRFHALADQRLREIQATAELQLKVLNERVQFLEEATQRGERLSRIYRIMVLPSRVQAPQDMAQEFLRLIQEEVGAEYASLALVKPDGTLGERADSFRGIEPFPISARPGGLGEQILKTGESQYIADTRTDPRANPALVKGGICSYLGLSVKTEGKTVGILFLHSTRPNAFLGEQEFLEAIASGLGVVLHRAILLTQVERAKREWETTFDAIGDGVAVVDGERKIIRANQAFAQLVGKPVTELGGKKICLLLHGREEPIPDCPLEKVVSTGKPHSLQLREPFLTNRLLDIRAFPIPGKEGEATRYVHFVRTLSEVA